MEDAVFKIGLSKSSINFVDFLDPNEFWNNSMFGKLSFSHLSVDLFFHVFWWTCQFILSDWVQLTWICAISLSDILIIWVIIELTIFIGFLMDQWKSNIIFEFGDCEVNF